MALAPGQRWRTSPFRDDWLDLVQEVGEDQWIVRSASGVELTMHKQDIMRDRYGSTYHLGVPTVGWHYIGHNIDVSFRIDGQDPSRDPTQTVRDEDDRRVWIDVRHPSQPDVVEPAAVYRFVQSGTEFACFEVSNSVFLYWVRDQEGLE